MAMKVHSRTYLLECHGWWSTVYKRGLIEMTGLRGVCLCKCELFLMAATCEDQLSLLTIMIYIEITLNQLLLYCDHDNDVSIFIEVTKSSLL